MLEFQYFSYVRTISSIFACFCIYLIYILLIQKSGWSGTIIYDATFLTLFNAFLYLLDLIIGMLEQDKVKISHYIPKVLLEFRTTNNQFEL